jgi:hypothetical protein
MEQDKEITREELHQLVRSKPTKIAAKEFCLSDVGLARIRRKLGGGASSRNSKPLKVPSSLLPGTRLPGFGQENCSFWQQL